METLVVHGTLVGDKKVSAVTIRDGRVASIGRSGRGHADIGTRETIIAPTLFDIQVNGIGGMDLEDPKLMPNDLRRMTDLLAASGVACWVPTLVTASLETVEQACRTIVAAMADPVVARAIPGIHLEGPHISPEDGPRGAHPRQWVRHPNLREFDRVYKAAEGRILYVTLAPEQKGAVRFIEALTKRGVVVSLGHHCGSPEQIARAVDAGARMCTHLGNGIASTMHRHHNPLWAQLSDDRLAASFLADLEHLPPSALKVLIRAKRPENTILASDCVHLTGLAPGRYVFGGIPVELTPSGRIRLTGTDLLAGSSLMLLQGIVNAARTTDLTLEQAFASAGSVPAQVLGVRRRFGLPREGAKADFVAFDIEDGTAVPRCVFVAGRQVALPGNT